MLTLWLLAAVMTDKPAQGPVVCRRAPPRGPSLALADAKGKCPLEGMKLVKDKDGKVEFCRQEKRAGPPVVCQQVPLPHK